MAVCLRLGKVKETLQPTEILGYKFVYFDFTLNQQEIKQNHSRLKTQLEIVVLIVVLKIKFVNVGVVVNTNMLD